MIYYHHSGCKTFKDYYCREVMVHLKQAFPNLVSYNRFIELKQSAITPLSILISLSGVNKCTGISFIDSFALNVCHSKRISSHKVFKNIAQRGKTSVGWFFGFKVHFVINHQGDVINFFITTGNIYVRFLDSQAIKDKIALAKKYNLKGVSIFKIDGAEDERYVATAFHRSTLKRLAYLA